MIENKYCPNCKETKSIDQFHHNVRKADGYDYRCATCANKSKREHHHSTSLEYRINKSKRSTERRHELGITKPMSENKECSSYLGIHITEQVLSKFFDNVQRMPNENPGFDFLCGKGFKIDAKSACFTYTKDAPPTWRFTIRRNEIADYFLCLGFNNRNDLTPMHVWLIPGEKINHLMTLGIASSRRVLTKWSKYERPLDKVLSCCKSLKSSS
jgi:hypothetical protein